MRVNYKVIVKLLNKEVNLCACMSNWKIECECLIEYIICWEWVGKQIRKSWVLKWQIDCLGVFVI